MTIAHPDPNTLYGPARVAAMHEISAFVRVSMHLHDIRKLFKKHAEIDYPVAKPRANRILKVVRDASASLLTGTMKAGDKERVAQMIADARSKLCASLLMAIKDARALMKQEVEALAKSGIKKSNYVQAGIYLPLVEISERWNGAGESA